MIDSLTQDFRALAMCALKSAGGMLDGLTPEAQHGIEGALQGGARLELSFGPIPRFDRLQLVLVEAEGRRHVVCAVEVAAPVLL